LPVQLPHSRRKHRHTPLDKLFSHAWAVDERTFLQCRGDAMTATQCCRLCRQTAELQDSHIWPKFVYRSFVTGAAGRFVDLSNEQIHNRQYTRLWYCKKCEGILSRSEDYTARWLRRLMKDSEKPIEYGPVLVEFCTSISMRVLHRHFEECSPPLTPPMHAALRHWRRFLLGKERDVSGFTQHAFLCPGLEDNGNEVQWFKALGGVVVRPCNFVLSQIGPLWIVGFLERSHLTAVERTAMQVSQVLLNGGTLSPVTEWRVGNNITKALAQEMCALQATTVNQVLKIHGKL